MMSSTVEVRCSTPESRADHKRLNFSYSREFLLPLAELAVCKKFPSSFDSSIMCEIEDASSGSSSPPNSEAGRWNDDLFQPLLPDNGILGQGSILKEPICFLGVSPPMTQGIGYHLDSPYELINALTSASQSCSDPDSVRLDVNLSQHSKHNTECGLLGSDALLSHSGYLSAPMVIGSGYYLVNNSSGDLLRNPGCLARVSAPMVQGSHCYPFNKCVGPNRPPHPSKMNLHSRRVHKDVYSYVLFPSSECPSMGSEEEERTEETNKSNERKQEIVSDEHKGKLDSDASSYPHDFRNDEMIVNKRDQSKEVVASLAPHNASYPFHTSVSIFKKGLETKSLNHSPMQENCAEEINCCMLSSSNFVDLFIEEEQNLAGGIANDKSEVHIQSNRSANKHEPRSFSSGRIDHKTAITLGSVEQSEGKGGNSDSDVDKKCDSVYIFDEKEDATNEICLPDEGSLISLDDLIFPWDYVMTPDNDDHKPTVFNPNIPGNIALASVNPVDSEPSYDNMQQERSFSLFHKNPGMSLFQHYEVRYQQNDPPRQSDSSINVPSKNPPAESTRFDSSIMRPLPHQVVFPCVSPHQLYRVPSIAPSDDSINEMNCAEEINCCMLSSSNFVDLFIEEEQNLAGGIANDKSEVHIQSNRSANKHEPRSFSSGRIDHKTAITLCSVEQSDSDVDMKCDSVDIFDEKEDATNEISLPDEDSLISLDDLIFPGDYVLTPDNDDHKPTVFNPNIPGNNALASVNPVDSEPSYDNMQQVRSYSLFHKNPGISLFQHSEVRYQQNDPPRQSDSSINVPSKNPPAESTRFDSSIMRPLPHQMIFPYVFPHQLFRVPSIAPSDDSINEMVSHSQQINHTHNFNRTFRGLYMPNPGHNTPFGTAQAKQVHPRKPWWRNI
ncbi:uncharacterized protein [Euphorbia lathyris]|uniref:uncharacterized protein n=1 Tax=Euphorbia lathyris TaxID=212925 RepID=UPI0033140050